MFRVCKMSNKNYKLAISTALLILALRLGYSNIISLSITLCCRFFHFRSFLTAKFAKIKRLSRHILFLFHVYTEANIFTQYSSIFYTIDYSFRIKIKIFWILSQLLQLFQGIAFLKFFYWIFLPSDVLTPSIILAYNNWDFRARFPFPRIFSLVYNNWNFLSNSSSC